MSWHMVLAGARFQTYFRLRTRGFRSDPRRPAAREKAAGRAATANSPLVREHLVPTEVGSQNCQLVPHCNPSTADLCQLGHRRPRPYQCATVNTTSQIGRWLFRPIWLANQAKRMRWRAFRKFLDRHAELDERDALYLCRLLGRLGIASDSDGRG